MATWHVTATATSPLAMDTTYLYWIGASGSGTPPPSVGLPGHHDQRQLLRPAQPQPVHHHQQHRPLDRPGPVEQPHQLHLLRRLRHHGGGGFLYKLPITPATGSNGTQPTAVTYGRTSLIHYNVALVDGNGRAFLVNPHTLGNRWAYAPSGSHGGQTCPHANCGARDFFYNWASERIYWGDYDGHLFAIANGAVVHANYPLLLESGTDVFTSAPSFRDGVIAIGSKTGKLYFVDEQSGGAAPALLRTYTLGTARINSIAYDFQGGQYVVGTQDGKLYYVEAIGDYD